MLKIITNSAFILIKALRLEIAMGREGRITHKNSTTGIHYLLRCGLLLFSSRSHIWFSAQGIMCLNFKANEQNFRANEAHLRILSFLLATPDGLSC